MKTLKHKKAHNSQTDVYYINGHIIAGVYKVKINFKICYKY